MRIAILTFHRAFNCGARLQAWALKTVLERMGHSVEFPNCNDVGFVKRLLPLERRKPFWWQLVSLGYRIFANTFSAPYCDVIRSRYERFQKGLNCVDLSPSDFSGRYDLVVVGSDQVWNEKISFPNSSLFLGEGIPKSIPLIAYSASLGEIALSEKYIEKLKECLPRFSVISLRETSSIKMLEGLGLQGLRCVVDPTLLLSALDYDGIKANIGARGDFLFTYAITYSRSSISKVFRVAKKLKVPCHVSRAYEVSYLTKPFGFSFPVSPAHLLAYTAQAKYVICASFHGMIFAILFHKPFVCMRPERDEVESRPMALLKSLGMANRIVTPETSVEDIISILEEPYPDDIDEKISALRSQSISWLEGAIGDCSRFERKS